MDLREQGTPDVNQVKVPGFLAEGGPADGTLASDGSRHRYWRLLFRVKVENIVADTGIRRENCVFARYVEEREWEGSPSHRVEVGGQGPIAVYIPYCQKSRFNRDDELLLVGTEYYLTRRVGRAGSLSQYK
jgi:hypothetical protein